jgi:hypothetical protein
MIRSSLLGVGGERGLAWIGWLFNGLDWSVWRLSRRFAREIRDPFMDGGMARNIIGTRQQ